MHDATEPRQKAAAQALYSLAAIAPGLTEPELRAALQLAALTLDATHEAAAGSRELARLTARDRRTVQRALDGLSRRGLITTHPGTATRPASYRLHFATVATIPSPAAEPAQGQLWKSRTGGSQPPPPAQDRVETHDITQVLAGEARHPSAPPIDQSRFDTSDLSIDVPNDPPQETPTQPAPAGASPLDRILTARPNHYPARELAELRQWCTKWLRLQRGMDNAHPPDLLTCAQIATAAGGAGRAAWFVRSEIERGHPDRQAESCQYLVSTAAQRFHRISPTTLRDRRAELKVLRGRDAGRAEVAAALAEQPEAEAADTDYRDDIMRQLATGTRGFK